MTENEAIEIINNNFPKTAKMVNGRYKGGFDDTECDFGKALLLSVSALAEIQQYRALGTVEKLRELKESALSGLELANIWAALERLKEYETIGTVEELREAKEKQRAKKALRAFDKDINQHWCSCPACAKGLCWDTNIHFDYCPNCGQAIDFSEEE